MFAIENPQLYLLNIDQLWILFPFSRVQFVLISTSILGIITLPMFSISLVAVSSFSESNCLCFVSSNSCLVSLSSSDIYINMLCRSVRFTFTSSEKIYQSMIGHFENKGYCKEDLKLYPPKDKVKSKDKPTGISVRLSLVIFSNSI